MDKRIGMWGYVRNGQNDGFGYAGYKIVRTLEKFGFRMLWEDETTPLALSFKQPHEYGGGVGQYNIGYTPWESTELPPKWAEHINHECDEFWTTSQFCADVFTANGVKLTPRVVPHGVDSDWTLSRRKKESPFIFLHQGEPAERKGSQLVFDAFIKLFGKNPDVHLVVKSASWVEARWKNDIGEILGPLDSFENVHIMNGYLTQPQLDELYAKAHCMVYPSNGEGFGLIPFQAAATGLPTIVANWGGVKEFGDSLLNVDYTVGPSNHDYHLGEWCYPDLDSICEQMSWVYETYAVAADDAAGEAEFLREKFDWEKIFAPIVEDLAAIF